MDFGDSSRKPSQPDPDRGSVSAHIAGKLEHTGDQIDTIITCAPKLLLVPSQLGRNEA
jgi:hypothetical protein